MKRASPRDLASLLSGTPLVIMLDIDGTLCEIVERPDDAAVPESARTALRTLLSRSGNGVRVAFVTGRSIADAQRILGVEGAVIHGNHGMERLTTGGNIRAREGSHHAAPEIRESAPALAEIVAAFPGTSMEDKLFSLSLHYRGMDMDKLPELNARVMDLARHYSLRLSPGKCVINVLPAIGLTKGDAVLEIVSDTGGDAPDASLLFVGDDVTDEDGFMALRAFPAAVTVRVGSADAESAARYSMDDTQAVHDLLTLLAEARA